MVEKIRERGRRGRSVCGGGGEGRKRVAYMHVRERVEEQP